MEVIETDFEYIAKTFKVGDTESAPGENEGSCKILSFARLTGIESEAVEKTLQLFGDFYRKDVLGSPDGTDHANIRSLMKGGWDSVKFPNGLALSLKAETFGVDAGVDELIAASSVIGEGDGWDLDSDSWIP